MQRKDKEERQPEQWEMTDPKPPVIHSGRMENQVRHQNCETP